MDLRMPNYSQFTVDRKSEINVLTFRDHRIHDQIAIEELAHELKDLTKDKMHEPLLIDMTGVEFVSSAVLNRLIVLDKMLKNSGGKLAFCSLRPEVDEVFSITQLHQVFSIFDDQAKAVASLSSVENKD